MPKPIFKGQSAGSGGPASSAQADIAPAEVASVYGLGGQFRLLSIPDVEYDTGRISSVYSRGASLEPRAMPAFQRDMSYAPQRKFKAGIGERPVTMLPTTNLEKVEPPPGMSYAENYTWDLALLLEGRTACYEKITRLGWSRCSLSPVEVPWMGV